MSGVVMALLMDYGRTDGRDGSNKWFAKLTQKRVTYRTVLF
jgi:hypothetical protein